MALHDRCSLKLNRYACGLGTIQSTMPPYPLEIKEKSYLTDAPPSDMQTNTEKLYQRRLLHSQYNIMPCRESLCRCNCNIYACWPSVTVTNAAAVQTCLLVECCCKMDAYWTVAQYCMSAGTVLLYLLYLLVWCLTISRTCWCGASL